MPDTMMGKVFGTCVDCKCVATIKHWGPMVPPGSTANLCGACMNVRVFWCQSHDTALSIPITWEERLELAQKASAANALPAEEIAKSTRAQAVSWVYGNCAMSNPNITIEMVEAAYDRHLATKG